MATPTYRVRVLLPETPQRAKYVESIALGFTLSARTVDAASTMVRARLVANGLTVRSVSHSPGNVIVALAHAPTPAKVAS